MIMMLCPVDQTQLAISTRDGIEIDYCPNCRGVWLDRGELDKLIERANAYMQPQRGQDRDERRDEYRHHDRNEYERRDDRRHDDDEYHHKKRKKESMFGDLFDFG